MSKRSAGLLCYRRSPPDADLEVLLVHPGGPFWASKDLGAWSIPKGEIDDGEDAETAARREFEEEIGVLVTGALIDVGFIRQPGGKTVMAWAFAGDFDPEALRSNTFTMEWPPRSGRRQEFPEVDRAAWFTMEVARRKILPGQLPLLDRLAVHV